MTRGDGWCEACWADDPETPMQAQVQLNPMPEALSRAVARAARAAKAKARSSSCSSFRYCEDEDEGRGGREGAWDPLDPMCALDEPVAALAGPAAWENLSSGRAAATAQALPTVHIAEKFRQAYIEQGVRLRDKERRLQELTRRRQLRGSPALSAMSAWLDDGPTAI